MRQTYRNVARVVKTHGRFGEVLVEPLQGLPFVVREGLSVALTPPGLKRDRFCRVEHLTPLVDGALVSFSGIETLGSAERIVGCYLLVAESDVSLGALDIAYSELIGRSVHDGRHGDLGVITEVMETPANDVWVVNGFFGEVLIPVVETVVDSVPREGAIEVHIMDGLLDANA